MIYPLSLDSNLDQYYTPYKVKTQIEYYNWV